MVSIKKGVIYKFNLQNYPFFNFNPSQIEQIKKKTLKNIMEEISPLYQPDNYKDRNDYNIYHEIYRLLVGIENQFIKND